MKTFILSLLFIGFCSSLKAQLANTKWHGTMNVPDPTDVVISFRQDTVSMYLADVADPVETMTYTIKGDTLFGKKVSGKSPCDDGSLFKLKYVINGNQLKITSIQDACPERSGAWPSDFFIKEKD